ncbi:peroxidase 29-like isoform X2 [Juglans regia]|uniref:Peroxidase n=1 Tax=Juglans regia TaxID=51240 RepID=A0A6P9F0Q1_JUGRE|nr:peroxidase 29-like isoform X2 [Juglans regia]
MGFPLALFLCTLGCFSASTAIAGISGILELHFYKTSCPDAEMIVREHVTRSMLTDPSSAAPLLRLAFHDCQVDVLSLSLSLGGCDGSILLKESSNSLEIEAQSQKNFGIRKLDIMNNIKSSLEEVCPQTVSCADIIQLAARDAINLAGGPFIKVLTGRRDSISASKKRAENQLPASNISVNEFAKIFHEKNINLQEGVALIGAHTLGIGHCRNFEERLRPVSDPTLSPTFSLQLQTVCSDPSLADVAFAQNDATAFIFDNHYFIDIQNGRGLLKIDSEIATDPRTMPHVIAFGKDMQQFFHMFTSGFLKLSSHKVLVGEEGEIRRDCSFKNS